MRNVYDVTARVFAAAVDDRVIAHTPCRKIRLPRAHGDELGIPSVDEVAAVADAIGARWRAVVVTLAGSGLRIGELRGLAVEDVDFSPSKHPRAEPSRPGGHVDSSQVEDVATNGAGRPGGHRRTRSPPRGIPERWVAVRGRARGAIAVLAMEAPPGRSN